MKNLKEIQEEISKIREQIYSSFSNIEFFEEKHEYFVNERETNERVQYSSVSSVIHRFEQPFDKEAVASRYAAKNGLDKDDVLRDWKYTNLCSTISGTRVHLYGEAYTWLTCGLLNKIPNEMKPQLVLPEYWLIPTSPKENGIKKFYDELHPTLTPIGAEFMLSSENLDIKTKMCGTTDLLLYFNHPKDDSKSGVILADWKGLPLDTPIATIDGWKTMREIEEGDTVFDKNGKPTKVIHVSQIHYNPCLKIKFDNNTSIVCDEEHRWEISFFRNKKIIHKIMTGVELYNYVNKSKEFKYNKPKIYNAKPIEMPNIDLPIHPYVLGVWLGDGHSADGKITNMYDELWEEIERCGYKLGYNVSKGGSGKAKTRTVFGLRKKLREIGCLNNKHIPDLYLRASYEQRLEILKGLMDTDGYYNKKRKRCTMCTTHYSQALFTVKLLGSLGIKSTIIKSKGKCNNCKHKKIFNKWDVSFRTNFYPFKIRKVDVEFITKYGNAEFRNIKNVEYCETVPTKCIGVDSDTHTYCCGYDMLVTHNTNKELKKDYARNNNIMMKEPFDFLIDEPLSHYTLQFGCYQLMLESIGIPIIGRRLIWVKDNDYEMFKISDVTSILRTVLN